MAVDRSLLAILGLILVECLWTAFAAVAQIDFFLYLGVVVAFSLVLWAPGVLPSHEPDSSQPRKTI